MRVFLWQFVGITEAALVAHWAFREPPISPGDAGLGIAFAAVVGLAAFQCVAAVRGSRRHLIAAAAAALVAVVLSHARISHSDAVRWNSRVATLRRDVARHCPQPRQGRAQAIVARWAASPKATTIACVSATRDLGAYANGYHPAILRPGDPPPCSRFTYANYHGRHLRDGALLFFYCPVPPGEDA